MNARLFVKRNASTILTGLGGIGVLATTITAVKATPKALRLIEEAEIKKGEKLTKWEKTRVAAVTYIPTIGIGVATVACIFGAHILNQRQQAALMSAYALLDQSYKYYRRKARELYGEETAFCHWKKIMENHKYSMMNILVDILSLLLNRS